MDKKKTQRILGVLVILALAIVIFPLLFSKSEVVTQTTSITAPPFPYQENKPTTVAAYDEGNDDLVPDLNDSAQNQAPAPVNNNNQLNDIVNPDNNMNKLEETLSQRKAANQTIDTSKNSTPKIKDEPQNSDFTFKKKDKPVPIAKLNQPAWVVQVGSFKNKNNASNLVDKLRVSGFNAFAKEIKYQSGAVRTRVFIGPEFKLASANQLSNKLEKETKMKGIVVSYKPLAL